MKCKYWNETLLRIRIDEPCKIVVRSFSLEARRDNLSSPFRHLKRHAQFHKIHRDSHRSKFHVSDVKETAISTAKRLSEIKRLHACLQKNTHRPAPRVFHELSNFGKTRRLRGRKEVERREREREKERAREPRGTQSVLRTCPECQSSKPPQKEYKNRAREARLGSRGNVSGRETGTEPEREEHGNYFRTVKPACEEGDASRHARIKGYLAE